MGHDLNRFSVTMPQEMLEQFDAYVARRGMNNNRSEAIRDMVRETFAREVLVEPGVEVIGTVTLMYDHHENTLKNTLDELQHSYLEEITASMHIHVTHHYCLEVIIVRGDSQRVHEIAHKLLGIKGVKLGNISTTPISEQL